MAFTTLAFVPPPLYRAIESREDLEQHIEASKLHALVLHNIIPGLRYHFEGLELHWSIVDEPMLRRSYASFGWSPEHIDAQIDVIRTGSIATNFAEIQRRFVSYKKAFDQILGGGKRSDGVDVAITFETLFDAGATPLKDGTDALTISAGMFNFDRWFALRQSFDDLCPIFVPSPHERTIELTPEQQRRLLLTMDGLHALSRLMFRRSMHKVGTVDDAARRHADQVGQFLAEFERENARRAPRPLSEVRSERRAAEIFMLGHELGHINLRHTDEVRAWYADPTLDPVETQRRLARRRAMEHEADTYGVGAIVRLVRAFRGKETDDFYAAFADPDTWRDVILPVADLFTITEMGQHGAVDFDAPDCPYPSNWGRLHHLLQKNDPAHPQMLRLWQQMQFFTAHETAF